MVARGVPVQVTSAPAVAVAAQPVAFGRDPHARRSRGPSERRHRGNDSEWGSFLTRFGLNPYCTISASPSAASEVDSSGSASDASLVLTLGVQTWGTDVAALQRYWAAAEALGYDRVVYGDGLWPWTCDGWTMLGALAAQTRRVRIGPAVTYAVDPSSHHPSWLAKRAATVDHLSNGRLDLRLGIGADDDATRELWKSHGVPYPPRAERVDRLAEAVEMICALWQGGPVERHGRFGDLVGAVGGPPPVQRPGPPVWIAAMSELALTLVARLADGWEASYLRPAEFARRWRQLRRLLEAERRDPESIRRSIEVDVVFGHSVADATLALGRFCAARGIDQHHRLVSTALAGGTTAVQQAASAYEAAGATDLLLGFADFPRTDMLEAFAATVTPVLRAAGTDPNSKSRRPR